MKLIEMSDYRRAAKIYWYAMVFAGTAVCVWAAQRLGSLTSMRAASWIAAPSMMAVTVFLAGNAFYFGLQRFAQAGRNPLGLASIPSKHLIFALAGMAMLHYFINGFSISTIYALKLRSPIL